MYQSSNPLKDKVFRFEQVKKVYEGSEAASMIVILILYDCKHLMNFGSCCRIIKIHAKLEELFQCKS